MPFGSSAVSSLLTTVSWLTFTLSCCLMPPRDIEIPSW
jgi:hypothetical protein